MKRTTIMKYGSFLLLVLSVMALYSSSISSQTTISSSWETYSNRTLGFSLKYPSSLSVRELSDGIILFTNRAYGNLVSVSNNAFGIYSSKRMEYFNLFQKSEPGRINEQIEGSLGTYTKISNLTVDGHSAVKMLYEYRYSGPPLGPNMGAPIPQNMLYLDQTSYTLSIYIRRSRSIWSISSLASDKKQQDERREVFDKIVSTFKFL